MELMESLKEHAKSLGLIVKHRSDEHGAIVNLKHEDGKSVATFYGDDLEQAEVRACRYVGVAENEGVDVQSKKAEIFEHLASGSIGCATQDVLEAPEEIPTPSAPTYIGEQLPEGQAEYLASQEEGHICQDAENVLTPVVEQPAEAAQDAEKSEPQTKAEEGNSIPSDETELSAAQAPGAQTSTVLEQSTMRISNAAKKLAEENGIDISLIPDRDGNGNITKSEVQKYLDRLKVS